MESTASQLIAAVENVWRVIQARNADVPDVVVTLGAGAERGGLVLGHFAPHRWINEDSDAGRTHELFVGGEGLQRGATAVLGTLLHEAAHGVANTRGIKDTSRQGRYHNRKFKALAEELGISVEHSPSLGHSTTTVPDMTAHRYRHEIDQLTDAITAHRGGVTIGQDADPNGTTTPKTPGLMMCACPRKIRCAPSIADLGPIVCSICDSEFMPRI